MEETEATPQRGFVIAKDIVCKSKPWIQVPHGWVGFECVRNVGVRGIAKGIHHVVKVPVRLNRVGLKLIAQSHVECEFAGYLPIILNVRRKGDVSKVAITVGFTIPCAGKYARGAA